MTLEPRFAALVLLLAACEVAVPAPRPLSITPTRGPDDVAVPVAVTGEGFGPRVETDFDERSRSRLEVAFRAWIGEEPLADVRWEQGRLRGTVPPGLAPGRYDLRVLDPAGREGRLEAAYEVYSAARPDDRIARFEIAPFAAPLAHEGFLLRITAVDAVGEVVERFNGQVELSDGTGTLVPRTAGSFVRGVWEGTAEVRLPVAHNRIRVEGAGGREGESDAFEVRPRPPARLELRGAPAVLQSGECSGSFEIGALDDLGGRVRFPVTVRLEPQGLGLTAYGDAACAVAVQAVETGDSGTAAVAIAAERAGPNALVAAAAGLLSARHLLVVEPGPPSALAVASAPQAVTAGTCSGAVRFEVRDARGNPAPVEAALRIALLAAPSAGLRFHSDAGCLSAPVDRVSIAAGSAAAEVHFAGTAAGPVRLHGEAAGLGAVEQEATILPGPSATLAFVTASQTVEAGACSAPLGLALLDAFGNRSRAPAALKVALAADPAAGFGFFADPGCLAPAEALEIPAGGEGASVYFGGTRAGEVEVSASAGGLAPALQQVAIRCAPAARLVFAPIGSPQAPGTPFPVALRAVDPFGNLDANFAAAASLSVEPAGAVACVSGCGGGAETAPFVQGAWGGSVRIGTSAGAGRTLRATAGTLTGTSNPFDLAVPEAPPLARIDGAPAVARVGEPVLFDAGASTDHQTPVERLQVSWDFDEAAGLPPWTAWSTEKLASHAFAVDGTFAVRLAVRDEAGGLGYAQRRVRVLPAEGAPICVVDVAAAPLLDDGANACAGPFGTDGRLSLAEAVRLSNDEPGVQVIAFSAPATLAGDAVLALADSVEIFASAGTRLEGINFSVTAGEALLSGLELSGQQTLLDVAAGATLRVVDSGFLDMPGIRVAGRLELLRAGFERCTNDCVWVKGEVAQVSVSHSSFRGGVERGIYLQHCGPGPVLELRSSEITGMACAIESLVVCPGTLSVLHTTFHGNAEGIRLFGGGGHVLRNAIFSGQAGAALECGAAAFAARDHLLLHDNGADGCLGADPQTWRGDPGYVAPSLGDLRLQAGSPARDVADDLGLDLNGPAPGRFEGSAPDLGGWETP